MAHPDINAATKHFLTSLRCVASNLNTPLHLTDEQLARLVAHSLQAIQTQDLDTATDAINIGTIMTYVAEDIAA